VYFERVARDWRDPQLNFVEASFRSGNKPAAFDSEPILVVGWHAGRQLVEADFLEDYLSGTIDCKFFIHRGQVYRMDIRNGESVFYWNG